MKQFSYDHNIHNIVSRKLSLDGTIVLENNTQKDNTICAKSCINLFCTQAAISKVCDRLLYLRTSYVTTLKVKLESSN